MTKSDVLAARIPSYAERKAKIEAEPLPVNVGALLDEASAAGRDTPMVNFFESGETLTYEQLRRRVNRLANGMLAQGIRKGTHVGVMMPNVVEFPITWLALARIGAVMVPINIAYTARELEYVITTADVAWLIIHQECLPVLDGNRIVPELIDESHLVVLGQSDRRRTWSSLLTGQPHEIGTIEPVGHDDLLNIQFTSGSTGFPKGVMLTQGYWLVSGKQNAFRDGRRYANILASTPFFYMDPQWQLLMALFQRGTLHVARRQSGSRYMDWVRKYHINFGLLPEVVFKQPPNPKDGENDVIRVNVYGISKDVHVAIEERFNLVAREAFGMTEIGTGLFMPIEADDMVGSGSCGVPAPFREARIVDEHGNIAPDGQVGELQVRGRSILKGYYNNPEATAKAFDGEWFRTGDLFRRDKRGYFTIVGRLKDMIRRAGENISAREVESVIVAMPQVVEVAVVAVKDQTRGEEAKAYIVLQETAGAQPEILPEIIQFCAANLAPFKVPRYYEFCEALPKTASGKISKPLIVAAKEDLRVGSFDRTIQSWI